MLAIFSSVNPNNENVSMLSVPKKTALKEQHARKQGGLIVATISAKRNKMAFPSSWNGLAQALQLCSLEVGAATRCRLFGPELRGFSAVTDGDV